MTVEEFEMMIDDLGQTISNMDDILLAAGGRLVDQMKMNAPVDTGALRNSIRAIVENNQLQIGMLVYGMFQNYGVKGTDDTLGITVQEGVFPRPRQGDKYSFRRRRFGITNQTFFDVDNLTDALIEAIEENTINQL